MSRTLEKHFFAGDYSKGPESEPHHCEVNNLRDDVDAALKKYHKWDGSGVGLIGLWTSPDNLRVHGGSFFTRGKIADGEHRFNCTDIWPEAHVNTTITINVSSCNNFTFNSGGLHSDFLASGEVPFTCHEIRSGAAPAHILPANFSKFNIGDFCIRMICHLSRSSSGKRGVILRHTIALYPGKGADLTRVANEQGPSWPGIKVMSGEFPLDPPPKTSGAVQFSHLSSQGPPLQPSHVDRAATNSGEQSTTSCHQQAPPKQSRTPFHCRRSGPA
jgi:hypothetical protein